MYVRTYVCHVMSYHVMSCRVMSCHAMQCNVNVMLCCCMLLCHVMLCYVMLCYVCMYLILFYIITLYTHISVCVCSINSHEFSPVCIALPLSPSQPVPAPNSTRRVCRRLFFRRRMATSRNCRCSSLSREVDSVLMDLLSRSSSLDGHGRHDSG